MKIAFVSPWYGSHIPGGMESETRRTAAHLQAAGFQVEVLTTCIRDFFSSWDKNYHRPGISREDGIPVRRFAVERTDRPAFQWASWRLQQGQRLTRAEELVYQKEMIRCPNLLDHIASEDQETIFFFIPYLFSTTIEGTQIWPERSAIIPCLHDESYAYLDIMKDVILKVRALILHSVAELELVENIYGSQPQQIRQVIGEGLDTDIEVNADRFRKKFEIEEPFILMAGRRDPGKNTQLLLHYWRRYAQEQKLDYKLVLMGPGAVQIDSDLQEYVIDLGYVDRQDKFDAFAAATILCQPSVHESFSLVIMESWLAETPVLVHGHCAVTVEHCRQSNGGLYFTTYPEFAETVAYLFTNETVRSKMGKNGREYVLDNYQWPTVMEKYRRLIGELQHAG